MTDLERSIRETQIPAGPARAAVLRRHYPVPVEDLWSACTEPDRLARWFLPVTGDLRLGGSFSLKGNASGEILACEPPHRLRVTWVFSDRPVDEVELRLAADGDGSVLEVEHATVMTTVEWDGTLVDVVAGAGMGWELPLTYSLPKLLAGTLPDEVDLESPEIKAAWAAADASWNALL